MDHLAQGAKWPPVLVLAQELVWFSLAHNNIIMNYKLSWRYCMLDRVKVPVWFTPLGGLKQSLENPPNGF